MKKLLILLLTLVLCVGCFVACVDGGDTTDTDAGTGTTPTDTTGETGGDETAPDTSGEEDAATLADAAAYLNNLYKDGKESTDRSYDVVARVLIGGVAFPVTWATDRAEITIKASDKEGFYTVVIPDTVTEEIAYVLTATITDADGKTETKSFNRKVPVINNAGIVTEPVENTAYKFFMKQANLGKTLYALGEMSGEKYIKSTNDAKAAPDFFVEKAEGGFKLFATINGVKTYINARTTTAEDGKVSKYLELSTEAGAIWTYDAEVNAWLTTIGTETYCVGTYSSYDTFCISEKSYINADNSGVSQFPAGLMEKAVAESLTPDEGPEAPTDLTSIADFNAIGEALAHDATTPEKYIVKGVITEIKNTQYGNLYIQDEAGNQLYIYGIYNADGSVRFDKMEPQPKVGDTITVTGVASNYNGPQMKNGWITELIPGEGGDIETDPPAPAEDKTIPQFNEIASAQPDKGDATSEKYTVTGTITEIKNTQYGNMYIQDAEGNSLYIYGIYNADGTVRFDAMNPQPKVGDTITVVGVACNYNGPQMKNGWVVDHKIPSIPAWDEQKDVITHLSFDELKINDATGLFTPGQASTWDKIATLDDTAKTLKFWGWVGIKGEMGLFGYQIDDNDAVYDASFAVTAEQGVVDAAAGTGADIASRMAIFINVEGIFEAGHTVKVLYKNPDGKAVLLSEFTLNMPAAPVAWDVNKDIVTHQSFDELRINGDGGNGVFAPGASAGWDKVATLDASATHLHYWGWIGAKGEALGLFGYRIDDGDAIYSDDFKFDAEQGVIDAAAGTGATVASRMLINIDLTGLTGTHKVTVYYKNAAGAVAILNEFTVKLPGGESETPAEGAPVVGTAYKLYFIQKNLDNKVLYLTGVLNGYYMATTETFAEGADFFLEAVDGGYHLYCTVGGAKTYVNMVKSGNYTNAKFEEAATTVYTYDETLKTLVGTLEDGSYIFGTKADGTYTTLGPMKSDSGCMHALFTTTAIGGATTPDEGGEETPDVPSDATATMTFADASTRTEMSDDKQVWVQNGITLTNDRGESTQPVKDYVNPVRIYAKTNLTIAYKGMTKIVFTCAGDKNFKADFTVSAGTLTVDGAVATLTFDAPVDSVTFTTLLSQVRLAQVDVYA